MLNDNNVLNDNIEGDIDKYERMSKDEVASLKALLLSVKCVLAKVKAIVHQANQD